MANPETVQMRDAPLVRAFWRLVITSERVVGVRWARSLAVAILRFRSRTPRGYVRSSYRLVSRPETAPEVLRFPSRWWSDTGCKQVNRLGLWFDLDLRDNLQRVLYFTGTYEPQLLRLFQRRLRQNDVFVDCGAHIGVHALPVARTLQQLGGGRVYAFEPAPDTAKKLRSNAAANQLDIEVITLALSDARATTTIRQDPRYDSRDLGVRSTHASGEPVATVETTTFDYWAESVNLHRLDLVKIDVEGSELLVLHGMRETLMKLQPRLVVVELKPASLERAGIGSADVRRFLAKLSYEGVDTLAFSNEIFVRT